MIIDTRTVFALAALAVGGVFIFGSAVGLFFAHSGPRRSGLVASAIPLALLLPTLAVSNGAFSLINAFSAMAMTGADASSSVVDSCRQIWTTVRVSAAWLSAVALVVFVLGLIPSKTRPGAGPCSFRRAAVLLFLPVSALLLSLLLGVQLRSAIRVSNAVVAPTDDAHKAAAERVMASEGLGDLAGAGGIAMISDHIARRASLGSVGALVVAVVLLGLTATGALLAAPVRAGGGFTAAAASLSLLVAIGALAVAAGLGDPLRLG